VIRIKSSPQARAMRGRIPEIVIRRMVQFEGNDGKYDPDAHGYLMLVESSDDLEPPLPEIGGSRLLSMPESDWPPVEYVRVLETGDDPLFEVVVPVDNEKAIAVFIPDHLLPPGRLREYLESTAENE